MSGRYEALVTTSKHREETQLFLSRISLDTQTHRRFKHIYRRSLSERPDQDNPFSLGFNEQKLARFTSMDSEMEVTKGNQVRFTKDIREEECSSRFLFVYHNTIISVFSVLPYTAHQDVVKQKKAPVERDNNFTSTVSYAHLLDKEEDPVDTYDAYSLENPDETNDNKTDIILDGMIVSFLEFKPLDSLKKDLNDQFKERYPEVNITLSKMKSIKRDLLKVANTTSLPVVILCYAYAYFETLAFSTYINKANRKLAASACLMLAHKFLHCSVALIDELAEVLRVSREDIISEEFRVLAALKFSLHYPETAIIPHYTRLMGPTSTPMYVGI